MSRSRALLGFLLSGACLLPIAQASAAGAGSGEVALETVVVTAQYRAENAQTVPISISSLSGEALDKTGYRSVTDLQYTVPGVQYDPTNGAAFQIRGVGSTSFDFSNEKSVNVVVDDVVMDAQRANGLIGLQDIQRVDVLMGPQGTLFGKNSTSGAIVVRTNNPVLDELTVKANASYGERNDYSVNATVNIPVGDHGALRISAFDQGQDGYGRYVVLNKDLGKTREYGIRAKFLYQFSDDLEAVVSADYERHWDTFIRTAVSNPASLMALQEAYGVTPGPKNADSADTSYGHLIAPEWGGSLRVTYKLGDDTLTSITAVRGSQYSNYTPADLLPGDVFAYIPYNHGNLTTFKVSQELRLASPTGQFIEYVGGVFYNNLHARQSQLQWATLGSPLVSSSGVQNTVFYCLTCAIGKSGNTSLFKANNVTLAAYGQVKLNFTPEFSLALGGRYTHDHNSQGLSYFDTDTEPSIGLPLSSLTFIPTSAAPVYPFGDVTGDDFSFKIAPQYRITDSIMVYASYTTGYKPAGIAFVGNKYDPFKAETVESWEVGLKSELLDRRLRLNLDLFRSLFNEFQATILTPIPDGIGGFVNTIAIGNAGGLRTEGVEGTFAAILTPELSINGGLTYTHAFFTDYVYNTTTNYTGTALTNSPMWSGFVAADYEQSFDFGAVFAHLDYHYRSKMWAVVGQPSYSKVPGFGLVNARVGFTPAGTELEIGLYARNLGNTYFSTGWQQYGALGLVHYTAPQAYRTIGGYIKASL